MRYSTSHLILIDDGPSKPVKGLASIYNCLGKKDPILIHIIKLVIFRNNTKKNIPFSFDRSFSYC